MRALHPAVLPRRFSAAVGCRETDSAGCGSAYSTRLLRTDIDGTGFVCLGRCRADTLASAAVRILPYDELRSLAARPYRDRGRELAAIVRPVGTVQGRQPSVDFDVADLGRLCGAVPHANMGQLDYRRLAPVAKGAAAN